MKTFVIVGGVAGGASAAARLRRLDENSKIILFERGKYISFANCGLPYYIGGVIQERDKLLVTTAKAIMARFNIDVRTETEVLKIIPHRKVVEVRCVNTQKVTSETYDELVLSPGASPLVPVPEWKNIPGVFTLRNMKDMDNIHEFINANSSKTAVVAGGGFIGLEMAENLWSRGLGVKVVQRGKQVLKHLDFEIAAVVHEHISQHVGLVLGDAIKAIDKEDKTLKVTLNSGSSISCDIVIMGLGVRPEVWLAKDAGLTLGTHGGIAVNQYLQTSDPHIHAVGDAVEVKHIITGRDVLLPLAGPANKQGRLVADNICGNKKPFRGVQGTEILKVFDLTVARTGIAEKNFAEDKEIPVNTAIIHSANHAGYYPGSSMMTLKLVYSQDRGEIMGAQIVGGSGVDKRIDVLATAIHGRMRVKDLTELELAYAPPYSSAKDPVNMLGFVAENILEGKVKTASWHEVSKLSETHHIVDVRTSAEFNTGAIEGAVHFPLDELRDNIERIPRDKPLLVYCAAGLRGYIACRILTQNGFAALNLGGGYKTYKLATKKPDVTPVGKKILNSGKKNMEKKEHDGKVKVIDACGVACPGPILIVHDKLGDMANGDVCKVSATDPGFYNDIEAWCRKTGNNLQDITRDGKTTIATIQKGSGKATGVNIEEKGNKMTIVVFSCDLDKVMGAFIIATGAASIGKEVTMFFTFWGLNALRRTESISVKKNIVEKMFGFMMPRGDKALTLSRMNMGGMGSAMMRSIMNKKNVPSLKTLMKHARDLSINFVACQMSMDVMGIKHEELIDGVTLGGVGSYVANADDASVNLFI